MAYWYKGKRYTPKTKVKTALKHLASRAWESIQGGHPPGGGGRDPEHYIAQALRSNVTQDKGKEEPKSEPTQPDNSSEKD